MLEAGAVFLTRQRVEEPRILCEWLASRLLRCGRPSLYTFRDVPVSSLHRAAMRRGLRRLASGEPLQYVLGEWDFRDCRLQVDSRALIPRPETEQLVQLVLDCKDLWLRENPSIADVGTGSGCIAISLATERPQARVTAFEISPAALQLASANAAAHAVDTRIDFVFGELGACGGPRFDAVVSNPPYIRTAVVNALPARIRTFEPRTALDGGPDGLCVIRRVARDAVMSLKAGGWLFLEMGDDQGHEVRRLLERLGFERVEIVADVAGRTRYVRGWLR